MPSTKDTLAYSAQLTPEEAAEYLASLAQSLRDGLLLLESGDSAITLEVGRSLQFELEASGNPEKGKHALELTLSWRSAEQVKPRPTLAIVAGAGTAASLDSE